MKDRAQIVIANHQSFFNVFALTGYLPIQICWLAKAVLFKIPFVGWSMKAAGYISVKREDRKSAYRSFMQAIEKVRSGCSLVIFPEGTRSTDGKVGSFKKGSHLLAVRSQAPIVCATVIGSGNILKKGSGQIRPGPIRIVLSPPIEVNEINSTTGEELLSQIRARIIETYAKHNHSL